MVDACLDLSPEVYCDSHGPIGEWDVSGVTDMSSIFSYKRLFQGDISKWDMSSAKDMSSMFLAAESFNGDVSEWDVSSVTDMTRMFLVAASFNGDISKWAVSRVVNMNFMFFDAVSFEGKLCGPSWVRSKATKKDMFVGSLGSISRKVCISATTQDTRQYVSRRPVTERELVARTPTGISFITSTIAVTSACPKCGTFRKSGRVSCCAPGGSWFKTCGGVVNKNVDHRWSEGVKACKRKFKSNQWHVVDA